MGRPRDSYILAAFTIDNKNSVMHSHYVTVQGVSRGVHRALADKKADFISIRRIRPDMVY